MDENVFEDVFVVVQKYDDVDFVLPVTLNIVIGPFGMVLNTAGSCNSILCLVMRSGIRMLLSHAG
jgi:hypothetical protein